MAYKGMGQVVTIMQNAAVTGRLVRIVAAGLLVMLIAGCNMFSAPKIKEEPIVPPDTLYTQAIGEMDKQNYLTAIKTLEKLERQHPNGEYSEKAKLMLVFAHYRIGKFDEAVLAADRYTALHASSPEVPYVLYLKGNSYFAQIRDITRDQQISQNAIETYALIISNYPNSKYAKDAREKLVIAIDQLAGKEMSVGRYYMGTGNYLAAINRFRTVAEQFQTSTHIEEALYRLTEANLAIGLTSEAQTAAAVLGHNYPQSTWYKQAFGLLEKQGLVPQVNEGSSLAKLRQG
jgi:outer membrane protein assembly factor BamD